MMKKVKNINLLIFTKKRTPNYQVNLVPWDSCLPALWEGGKIRDSGNEVAIKHHPAKDLFKPAKHAYLKKVKIDSRRIFW